MARSASNRRNGSASRARPSVWGRHLELTRVHGKEPRRQEDIEAALHGRRVIAAEASPASEEASPAKRIADSEPAAATACSPTSSATSALSAVRRP